MSHIPSDNRSQEDSSSTSLSLLQRVRDRDDGSWNRFSSLYCPVIYAYCRSARVDAASADDICQEVLASVSRNIVAFRKENPRDTFRGWLYRIVWNKIRDHYRTLKNSPRGRGGSSVNELLQQFPEEFSDNSLPVVPKRHLELRRALEIIRDDFDPKTWQAFLGMTVERLSAQEVGEKHSMTARAVRQAKYRVVQRFRSEFGDLLDV